MAAAAAFADLLADQTRVLGPNHPATLTTRLSLARWQGEAGDAEGAARQCQRLLNDQVRVLGPDHPETMLTRRDLARWHGDAGDAGAAVASFEDLGRPDPPWAPTIPPPRHPRASGALAAATHRPGCRQLLEELLVDRLRARPRPSGHLMTRQDRQKCYGSGRRLWLGGCAGSY
jgi:hypothetical protein